MLPSRTNRSKVAKRKKQRKRTQRWITINMVLVLLVAGVFIAIRTGDMSRTLSDNQDQAANQVNGPDLSNSDSESNEKPADDTEQDLADKEEDIDDKQQAIEEQAPDPDPILEEGQKLESQSESQIEQSLKNESDEKINDESNKSESAKEPVKEEVAEEEKLVNTSAKESITMHFAGDVQFSGKVEDLLLKKGFDYPYQHLGSLFTDDDLTFVNLETPVTTGGVAAQNKSFVYKSSPKALKSLAAAGVDVVNLANNHILDQGVKGLTDTLTHLNNNKLSYVGAGLNRKEAYSPVYYEKNGIKIALLGFTRVMPEASWRAEAGKPGVADAYNSTEAVKAIKQANKKADLVIVMAHWGKERQTTPDENQKNLGYEFIDAGADLVIGGHPHVLQGLESYKGKWIAYSTGNFIFSRSATAETWKTAIFEATCQKDGNCGIKLLPYHAELGQPVPMNKKEGTALLREVQSRSFGAEISEDGTVSSIK
ncbi:CapA family protein [Paenibacillus gallinarum]|uniref:CapA family protein n=1 Tax=Paenibacillus gallinarum TaxID=2762232 RepID=A0ABR8SUP7_9BACL|nr:CapA family protein [Paenibacillus gallinarum]